jgi:hypothetical protein
MPPIAVTAYVINFMNSRSNRDENVLWDGVSEIDERESGSAETLPHEFLNSRDT